LCGWLIGFSAEAEASASEASVYLNDLLLMRLFMFYVDVGCPAQPEQRFMFTLGIYVCMCVCVRVYLCVRLFDFMQYLFAAHTHAHKRTPQCLYFSKHIKRVTSTTTTTTTIPTTTTTTTTKTTKTIITWVTHVRGAHLISIAEVD